MPKPPDPRAPLIHGVVWTAFGIGGMLALLLIGRIANGPSLWPLPMAFLGIGLILYYALASERAR